MSPVIFQLSNKRAEWGAIWTIRSLSALFPLSSSRLWHLNRTGTLGPVSLRLMTSQFKDFVTHTQKRKQWNAYFAVYGFKILCEIWKGTFEISYKILNPYSAKYAFYEVLKIWRLTISKSYDILSLSETGPWWSLWIALFSFLWHTACLVSNIVLCLTVASEDISCIPD